MSRSLFAYICIPLALPVACVLFLALNGDDRKSEAKDAKIAAIRAEFKDKFGAGSFAEREPLMPPSEMKQYQSLIDSIEAEFNYLASLDRDPGLLKDEKMRAKNLQRKVESKTAELSSRLAAIYAQNLARRYIGNAIVDLHKHGKVKKTVSTEFREDLAPILAYLRRGANVENSSAK